MTKTERTFILTILVIVASLVGLDILTDSKEGIAGWHIWMEASVALASLFGIFYLLRDSIALKTKLKQEIAGFSAYKKETELANETLRLQWQAESRKYLDGLAQAIDQQLTKWSLTGAEKEVAFLLLKGMSLKEIADIRQTAEKTAKVQSIAIYAKSGLAGRSELSAFFLEDLLAPQEKSQTNKLPN